jgi:hypothetical protein
MFCTVLADGTINASTMGSGQLASAGWRRSGYVRGIQYYNPQGQVVMPADGFLTPRADPGYGAQVAGYAPPWNRTLWFGGPGGVRS